MAVGTGERRSGAPRVPPPPPRRRPSGTPRRKGTRRSSTLGASYRSLTLLWLFPIGYHATNYGVVVSSTDLPGRIVVVDDDPTVADVVGRYLVRDGHTVECIHDGHEALRRIAEQRPDLVVLDLMLPGIDGLEVCRRLRERWPIPVVMLTALGDETDRLAGFELGADDYVTKPFSPRELALRVRSVLRRSRGAGLPDKLDLGAITDGNLVVDLSAHEVRTDGKLIQLTSR